LEISYNRGGNLGDKISLQFKEKVNALNQQNAIIYSHYTHTNICIRHYGIVYHNKVKMVLLILWFFGMSFFVLGA